MQPSSHPHVGWLKTSLGSRRSAGFDRQSGWRSKLLPALVTATLLALFWLTLYPGVGGRINAGDSAKFQYVGRILGVPHAPGYPQYVLLTHFWTSLPWPFELAKQVNLFSAVASVAAALLFFLALRRLTESATAAALATFSLFLARTVWTLSTEAEVHTLQLFWTCLMLLLFVHWRISRRFGTFAALVLSASLSLGNHPLAVIWLVGLACAIACVELSVFWSRATVLLLLLAMLVGASQYAFLYVRSHQQTGYLEAVRRDASVSDVVHAMTGGPFKRHLDLADGSADAGRARGVLSASSAELELPVLMLALVGALLTSRRTPDILLLSVVTVIGVCLFIAVYHVDDWRQYVPLVWLGVCLLAALGATLLPHKARPYVLSIWAIALVISIPATYGRMRTATNRFDESTVIARAQHVGSPLVVVGSGSGYENEQIANYYRLGLGYGRTHPPAVENVRRVVSSMSFMTRSPVITKEYEAVKALLKFDVRFRSLYDAAATRHATYLSYYERTRFFRVRPDGQHGFTVLGSEGRVIFEPHVPLQIAVVDPARGAILGRFHPEIRGRRAATKKVWSVVAAAPSTAWVVVSIQSATPSARWVAREVSPGSATGGDGFWGLLAWFPARGPFDRGGSIVNPVESVRLGSRFNGDPSPDDAKTEWR